MSRALFEEFISKQYNGSRTLAAVALGIDQSMVSRLCSGYRAVSPRIAQRIEALSHGQYKKEQFIWPEVEE